MLDHYILDENKNAVRVQHNELIEWMKKNRNRHVGHETVDGYRVSTVFLTVDHNHWGGSPILFETMIFDASGDPALNYQERCSTWEQAEKMHKDAVAYVERQNSFNPTKHNPARV